VVNVQFQISSFRNAQHVNRGVLGKYTMALFAKVLQVISLPVKISTWIFLMEMPVAVVYHRLELIYKITCKLQYPA
jgi:hypothetical protein